MRNRGQMCKGRYKSSLGNCRWGRVFWTTDLEECKTADLVQESKRRFGLVVRLKAIDHYERFLCYLFFLPLPSSFLIWLVSIVTRFLFVGLVEVVRRRHFLWNPNNLIPSDLSWSKAGLKILHPGPVRIAPLLGRSRCHTQPLRESDSLCLGGHFSRYAQALHRLEGFPLPILSRF